VAGDEAGTREEQTARVEAAAAAIAAIDKLAENPALPRDVLDRLRALYSNRIGELTRDRDDDNPSNADFADAVRLTALAAERKAVIALRHRRVIGDSVLHAVQRELDLIETALKRRRPSYSQATWLDLARRTAAHPAPAEDAQAAAP
jgi:hypothetical protein